MTTAHPHTDLDEIAFTAAELIRPVTVLLAAIRHAKSTADGDEYDALCDADRWIDRARTAVVSASDALLTQIATDPVGYLPTDPRPTFSDQITDAGRVAAGIEAAVDRRTAPDQ